MMLDKVLKTASGHGLRARGCECDDCVPIQHRHLFHEQASPLIEIVV